MLIRAIALSIALLIGMGTIIPLATEYAQAGPKRSKKYRQSKRYKKYSKRWWRQYHARVKRNKNLRARRRAMRLRQLRLARNNPRTVSKKPVTAATPVSTESKVALLPSGQPAPDGWRKGESTGSEVRFKLENGNGAEVGSASISVLGPASGVSVSTGRNPAVGGVPTSALRREVINRMVRENGWVVNDYQKEIGGKTVYVVVAQSQEGSRVQSRMFYFTEADGRIYSVATNTPADTAERLAEESEKVIFSLQARPRPIQQAAVKE